MSHALAACSTKTVPAALAASGSWPALFAVLAAGLLGQAGCTTALTTAALRDALWSGDPAAEELATTTHVDDTATRGGAAANGDVPAEGAADEEDAERRQAAITAAIERLAHLGPLDPETQAALVETLQGTQQQDWPVVIDAFAATLHGTRRPPAPTPEPLARPTEPPAAAAAPEPAASVAPEPQPLEVARPADGDAAATAPPPPADSALAIRNACFASKVQAWGVVERLPAERLAADRDVIVYFEVEGLSGSASAAGVTTCIDTSLRLVAADGRELEAWTFDPITETCAGRRRDYFARYVVRLPSATGTCRLEVAVTDTIAGTKAAVAIPCAIE